MASPSSPQHEPTMEEILASIRKIISEDSSDTHASKQDGEVLELTPIQEVRDEPRPSLVAATPQSGPIPSPVPMPQAPDPVVAPKPNPVPPTAVAPQPQSLENDIVLLSNEETTVSSPARTEPQDEGILSNKARKAIDDAFASLDEVEVPRREATRPTFTTASVAEGNSVEAVFERAVQSAVEPLLNRWMDNRKDDLLGFVRPMIHDWMDEHFPAILEGAVREEVARVLKARGR